MGNEIKLNIEKLGEGNYLFAIAMLKYFKFAMISV